MITALYLILVALLPGMSIYDSWVFIIAPIIIDLYIIHVYLKYKRWEIDMQNKKLEQMDIRNQKLDSILEVLLKINDKTRGKKR